jgi:hypothetical protein
MTESARTIYKRYDRAREEVRRLLAMVFASELLQPSRELWLVSPWLRDVAVLDNRTGDFAAIVPAWAQRELRILDCLTTLLDLGVALHIKVSKDPASQALTDVLRRYARERQADDRLRTRVSSVLHTKGLVTSRCLIRGSMNFTVRGVELNEEAVTYDVDPAAIADMRIAFADQW